MSKVKYILYPGNVKSVNDGDWHFITYGQLIRLYGLAPAECINGRKLLENDPRLRDHTYFHLYPIIKGNYKEYLKNLEREIDQHPTT
jgi:hypothetical protein